MKPRVRTATGRLAGMLAAGCLSVSLAGLSSPLLADTRGQVLTGLRIPMRDGVHVVGDVMLPPGPGPFPVIVEFTPYGRGPDRLNFRGEAPDWNGRGYALAMVDSRGQGESEGTFAFFNDGDDGYDLVEWLARQPWSNGRVGMRGSSYTGTNQWYAAKARPPHLRCITPDASGNDPLHELVPYHGGAFNFQWALTWVSPLSDSGVKPQGPLPWDRLRSHRPVLTADEAAFGRPLRLYREFLAHPTFDDYWKPTQLTDADYAAIDIPSLAFTGWFDGTLPGTVHHFGAMRRLSPARDRQFLVIGPWEHLTAPDGGYDFSKGYQPARKVGEYDVPENGFVDGRDLVRRFFDWCLKDGPKFEQAPARIFLTGSNRWLDLEDFPAPNTVSKPLYLASAGRANGFGGDGTLQWNAPRSGRPDRYVFDPQGPLPDVKLEQRTAGPVDLGELIQRKDGLVYTSAPMTEAITIAGNVTLVLHASSDARDTDWIARLEDVGPDGRARKLGSGLGAVQRARYRAGYAREVPLTPGRTEEYRLEFFGIGHTFLPGHRVRVSLSSSAYPWFNPNPGTGNPIATDTAPPRVARQTIFHDRTRPSRLLLPVIPGP